jgi:uncharacterized protein YgiM (DUF1202 family)
MNGQWIRPGPSRFRVLSFALIAIITMTGLAISAAPRNAGAADFSTGDTVVTTDRLNLRADATTSAGVVTVLENGTMATVSDGPKDADGHTWYKLDVADGSVGWAAGDFLALAGAQDPGFSVGDQVVVTGGSLNLRDNAGLSANVLNVMADGSTASVLSGPATADGLPWYQLDTTDYGQGWAVGGFLALANGNTSGGTFPADAALIVKTDDGSNLNLRQDPSINGALVGKLPDGSRVVVLDGPQSADGYDWYHLDTDLGTGWAAGQFLVTPADGIAAGDTVSVADGPLNLRDNAGLSANVIAQLPNGTVLHVSDGPVSADGYTWFSVSNTDFGSGWVAGEFLQVGTGTGNQTSTASSNATATASPTAT